MGLWKTIKRAAAGVWAGIAAVFGGWPGEAGVCSGYPPKHDRPSEIGEPLTVSDLIDAERLQPGVYLYAAGDNRPSSIVDRQSDLPSATAQAGGVVMRQWPNVHRIWETRGTRVGLLHAVLADEGLDITQRNAISRWVMFYRRMNRNRTQVKSESPKCKDEAAAKAAWENMKCALQGPPERCGGCDAGLN